MRDYSAKTFSLLMRRLKLKAFKSQSKLLLRAVAANCRSNCTEVSDDISLLAVTEFEGKEKGMSGIIPSKRIQDLLDGLALLFFSTCKGVKSCLHSKGGDKLSVVLDLLFTASLSGVRSEIETVTETDAGTEKKGGKEKKESKGSKKPLKGGKSVDTTVITEIKESVSVEVSVDDTWMTYTVTQVLSTCVLKLFRHLHPSNLAELWIRLLSAAQTVITAGKKLNINVGRNTQTVCAVVECSTMFIVEAILFGLCHTKGRGLSDTDVRKSVEEQVITVSLDLIETGLTDISNNNSNKNNNRHSVKGDWRSARLIERERLLLCKLWLTFPRNLTLLHRIDRCLASLIPCIWPSPAALLLSSELFPVLPVDISKR